MRSNFASVINSVTRVQNEMHRFFIFLSYTTFSFWPGTVAIFEVMSVLFFSAKNASVTTYLLESSLAQFKKCQLLFYNFQGSDKEREHNYCVSSACLFPHLCKRAKSSYSTQTSKMCDKRNFIITTQDSAALTEMAN